MRAFRVAAIAACVAALSAGLCAPAQAASSSASIGTLQVTLKDLNTGDSVKPALVISGGESFVDLTVTFSAPSDLSTPGWYAPLTGTLGSGSEIAGGSTGKSGLFAYGESEVPGVTYDSAAGSRNGVFLLAPFTSASVKIPYHLFISASDTTQRGLASVRVMAGDHWLQQFDLNSPWPGSASQDGFLSFTWVNASSRWASERVELDAMAWGGVQVVPEPGTVGLWAAGLFGLGATVRRKRRQG